MLDFPQCSSCVATGPGQVLLHSHLTHPADLTSLTAAIQSWLASRPHLTLLLIENMQQYDGVKGEVKVKEEVDDTVDTEEIVAEVDPVGEESGFGEEEEQFSDNEDKAQMSNEWENHKPKTGDCGYSEVTPKKIYKKLSLELKQRIKLFITEKITQVPNISSRNLKKILREEFKRNHGERCTELCVCNVSNTTFNSFVDRNMEKFKATGSIDRKSGSGRPGIISKSNICDECGYAATGIRNMYDHRKLHHKNKEKTCQECGEMVKQVNMSYHIASKHREKMFCCNVCGKSFSTNGLLKKHELIHSENRAYPCRYECGYASKTSGNRNVHERNVHKRLNNNPEPL